MTFTHDDIQDRLIEFLYGELDGDARAAFEAHTATCERCRADVTQFQNTRAVARAAVRSGLEDEPPAGVRARVLEAAGATKPAAKPVSLKSKAESGGPFAWLRARWAVPMFVTAAAMGALLLVRETIYREARKPLGDSPAAPEMASAPAPAERSPMPPAPSQVGEARPPEADSQKAAEPAETARQVVRVRQKAERRRPAMGKSAGGGAPRLAPADRPVPQGKASAKALGASDSVDSLLSGSDTRRPGKRELSDDAVDGLADKSNTRGFAQPPPPRAAAVPRAPTATAAAPAPAAPSVVMDTDDAPERPQRMQKRAAGAAAEEEAAAMPASAPASARADREEEGAQSDPAAPLAARAEKLMAAQQWAEAAAAYRQLIARFPKHEQVPNWRRRLAVVEGAATRTAPASK
jgi:hypothetical protein